MFVFQGAEKLEGSGWNISLGETERNAGKSPSVCQAKGLEHACYPMNIWSPQR